MTRERNLLTAVAETHHGVVASHHLTALGFNAAQRDWLVASGVLVRARYGSYRIGGAPASWKGDLLAAGWAGGTRAVGSHRSAAAVHDLTGGDTSIQEVTCPELRRARHDFIAHETKELTEQDIEVVDGIHVTTVERTLLDLG